MTAVQPPYFMQTGAHPAQVFRRTLKGLHRVQGIVAPGDLAVSAVAGDRAVSVAAGEGIIFGTENVLRQGAYNVLNDAAVQLAIAAADVTNPRYDRIVAQVRDAEFSGANNDWLLAVVQGAPAAVPIEPALPANVLELARLKVNANALSFVAGDLLERRARSGPPGTHLAAASTFANGVDAVGMHDSGLVTSFVMPSLPSGRFVLIEATVYGIEFAASGTSGIYLFLVDGANTDRAASFVWSTQAGTFHSAPAPARGLLDNTMYPAGQLVTLKLRTTTTSGASHHTYANWSGASLITAILI